MRVKVSNYRQRQDQRRSVTHASSKAQLSPPVSGYVVELSVIAVPFIYRQERKSARWTKMGESTNTDRDVCKRERPLEIRRREVGWRRVEERGKLDDRVPLKERLVRSAM